MNKAQAKAVNDILDERDALRAELVTARRERDDAIERALWLENLKSGVDDELGQAWADLAATRTRITELEQALAADGHGRHVTDEGEPDSDCPGCAALAGPQPKPPDPWAAIERAKAEIRAERETPASPTEPETEGT